MVHAAHWGGLEWSDSDIIHGYLKLSAACLTTTFIITQRSGACRRIVDSENQSFKSRWLPGLNSGATFGTVGISHLTTSRRHLAEPALRAEESRDGFVLDGYSPWVTGAQFADIIVLGATLADGQQILIALPGGLDEVVVSPPHRFAGLTSSFTGELHCNRLRLGREWLLAGPSENVMAAGGANTGGLQTSTLAIGLSHTAITYLENETRERSDLKKPTAELRREHLALQTDLLAIARGKPVCTNEALAPSQ